MYLYVIAEKWILNSAVNNFSSPMPFIIHYGDNVILLTSEICALLGYYAVPSGKDYYLTPHNIPEEHRSHQYHGGKLVDQ
jgi:hypothetical protein